jgi:hypothetical protein
VARFLSFTDRIDPVGGRKGEGGGRRQDGEGGRILGTSLAFGGRSAALNVGSRHSIGRHPGRVAGVHRAPATFYSIGFVPKIIASTSALAASARVVASAFFWRCQSDFAMPSTAYGLNAACITVPP